MLKLGILERYQYKEGDKMKTRFKLSDEYRYYGYNKESSSIKIHPYSVLLYEDRFEELMKLMTTQGVSII